MKKFFSVQTVAVILLLVLVALFASACKGDIGSQGERGATGPQGLAGAQGATGTQGAVGLAGPAGPQTGASIMVDKDTYLAGTKTLNVEFTIYGAGYLPSERVEFKLFLPNRDSVALLSTTADSSGSFIQLVKPFFTMSKLGHYALIATGEESGASASTSLLVVKTK